MPFRQVSACLPACYLCGRYAAYKRAVTACSGDPHDTASWRREALPVCQRCNRALAQAEREGRKVKATRERPEEEASPF